MNVVEMVKGWFADTLYARDYPKALYSAYFEYDVQGQYWWYRIYLYQGGLAESEEGSAQDEKSARRAVHAAIREAMKKYRRGA